MRDPSLVAEYFVLTDKTRDLDQIRHLSGYAISGGMLIFGTDGLKKFLEAGENFNPGRGRYSYAIAKNGVLRIGTDPLGQDLLFYFNDGSTWGVSNSLYLLCEELKTRVSLKPRLSVLANYLTRGGTGSQLISAATPVQGISMLPLGQGIEIDLRTRRLNTVEIPSFWENFQTRHSRGTRSYSEAMRKWIAEWSSIIRSVHDMGIEISADLSGGADSRMNLALLLASGLDLGKVNFRSNKDWQEDLAVAQAISSEFGLPLNENGNGKSIPIHPEDSLELWKIGNLGIYRNVYFIRGVPQTPIVQLHGGGGGLMRNLFNATPQQRAKKLARGEGDPDLRREIKGDLEHFFEQTNLRAGRELSLDDHYLFQRNRLHFGRGAYRNISSILLTPLCDIDLLPLRQAHTTDANTFAIDVFAAISPKLGMLPFDKPEKTISQEDIDASPLSEGSPLSNRGGTHYGAFAGDTYLRADRSMPTVPKNLNKVDDLFFDEAERVRSRIGNDPTMSRIYSGEEIATLEGKLALRDQAAMSSSAVLLFMDYFLNNVPKGKNS